MKTLKYLLLGCISSILIIGSIKGQQFIPKELKSQPRDSLAKLVIDITTKKLTIGGQKVKKSNVFLNPGNHHVRCEVRIETEEWKSMVKSMKEKGYTLRSDGTFIRSDGTTATPLGGPKRYKWIGKYKAIFFEKGKVYRLSTLL